MFAFENTASRAKLHHLPLQHTHDELRHVADEGHMVQAEAAGLGTQHTPAEAHLVFIPFNHSWSVSLEFGRASLALPVVHAGKLCSHKGRLQNGQVGCV